MIGHVLCHIYESCGALVYRVNHINDFGGFGFMLEGYRRFESLFPEAMGRGDRLLTIYAIRRALERAVAAGTDLDAAAEPDGKIVATYFPGVTTADALRKIYDDFAAASDARPAVGGGRCPGGGTLAVTPGSPPDGCIPAGRYEQGTGHLPCPRPDGRPCPAVRMPEGLLCARAQMDKVVRQARQAAHLLKSSDISRSDDRLSGRIGMSRTGSQFHGP
jgi:hypothetical protein